MKTIKTLIIASALVLPVAAFAQSTNSGLTRAQVKSELVQLEQAGYTPGQNDIYYPDNIQHAEKKVNMQHQ